LATLEADSLPLASAPAAEPAHLLRHCSLQYLARSNMTTRNNRINVIYRTYRINTLLVIIYPLSRDINAITNKVLNPISLANA